MNNKIIPVIYIIMIFAAAISPRADVDAAELREWEDFSESPGSASLKRWIKDEARCILTGKENKPLEVECPPFYGRFGIFVTVVSDSRVRGCFGAFDHRYDKIDLLLRDYLRGALRRDDRYPPVETGELDDIDIIITVTTRPHQAGKMDIDLIDISRYGVMFLMSNGERMVLVPAEIKTHQYLKGRIKDKPVGDIFIFRAITIK